MAEFLLKKGYDIGLDGETEGVVEEAGESKFVALKPSEFLGIKPRLMVAEGDAVKLGTPLFHSKVNDKHVFTSPASGRVSAIKRGAKRVLEHLVIERDGKSDAIEFQKYPSERLSSISRDDALRQLLDSGMLPVFRERPFDYVADPNNQPRDIFVSAMDTAPLAPDVKFFLEGNEKYFQAGLDVASRLTTGRVHLSIDGGRTDLSTALTDAKGVVIHRFTGQHPVGCVGVQIHHIAPISGRTDIVWYATVQGLIRIGKLFIHGRISPEVLVSVAGSAATNRKYFRTTTGAAVKSLVANHVRDQPVRYISGNVLTGKKIDEDGYIGFYDSMITVIPESKGPEFVGWMLPGIKKQSFYRTHVSGFLRNKKFVRDTKLNGGVRAFVATGYYEQVLPMRIYPMFLLKSILAGDIEEMEGLGIYEVTEEEMALCEYICPSKIEIQKIIRDGLTLIEKEG